MHSCKRFISTLFTLLFTYSLLFSTQAVAKQNNDELMSLAIVGAISSLGVACYQGKTPCSFTPGLNMEQLTFSLDVGSDNTAEHLRLGLGADWQEPVFETASWEIAGRLEGSLHAWSSTLANPESKTGYMIGLTPVFHYQPKNFTYTPFIELGGGPHLLSKIMVENDYKSTQFQFGSIVGFGIKNQDFEISYRYLHISNAGIEMPNPGSDFHNIHIGYYF